MEPDLYLDMERAEYNSIDALNQSTIKVCHERSLAHARYELEHPSASTPAQIIGQALHTMILEPQYFNDRYGPMPVNAKGDRLPRTTTAGELAWDAYDDQFPGRHPIKPAEFENMKAIREAVLRHPTARAMIEAAPYKEVSFFWEHPDYGFPCKAQADLLTLFQDWSWCVDLKSTIDASDEGFSLEVARYSYMIQKHWYLEGLNELVPAERRFAYIAFEKDPPYAVQVHELDAETALEGQYRCDKIARRWDRAIRKGSFEGYPTSINQTRGIRWAMTHERMYDEEEED